MTERKAIPHNDPIYSEICEFLHREAELLDHGEFEQWLELLADDISYRLPVRLNRSRKAKAESGQETEIFSDNKASLVLRVKRLGTDFAWAETPPSRTRHLVTNVRVRPAPTSGEMEVSSYFLVYRNRSSYSHADLFSGEREDLLRRVNGDWLLARRTIQLDQAVIGSRNISIFF